ncbi:hypothetical protein SKAU_G00422260 [Synaphobranchus kaupii]|uniref:SIS domain-containing protein n=1 Tax=Synaphobranchus kaupii TaxID=118154 RepID=A0A9Q1IAG0_SYNKA|nr:hypothetical protein SKAU_G00422260 [Synaphobranchus kaupii]
MDRAPPEQLLQLLRDCDLEIFQHLWESGSGYQTIVHVAKKVEDILKHPEDSLIVMSGCGTSGRLAYLLAISFNRLLKGLKKQQVFAYTIAGGDKALLTSQEAPEDSPQLGALNLEQVCAGKRRILFIGISCGLSAPYVAGQLDFCMNHLNVFTPVLIGFNPVNMARNESIPDWSLTFRSVTERMEQMQKTNRAFILNPAVGPEPISGSSRMKAGSATKILLETLLWAAHTSTLSHTHTTHSHVLKLLRKYEQVHTNTYNQSVHIAALVKQAGTRGRHDFTDNLDAVEDLAHCVKPKTSSLHAVTHAFGPNSVPDKIKDAFASVMTIAWPRTSEEDSPFLLTLQAELSTKWVLNAISTGAHILKGKIYRNYMVDLKVTNSKLFRRAVTLLQLLSGCAAERCHGALIQAIYSTDEPTEEMNTASLTERAHIANTSSKVVPTALLMLRWSCSVCEARARLQGHMIIRDAVEACLTASTCTRTAHATT